MEKYWWIESEADAFESFMIPMLEWDQEKWASAQEMLWHPWLKMGKNDDFKMSEKQHNAYVLKSKLMEIDKDDATYHILSHDKFADAEADVESTKSEESDSDFEIEYEKHLKSWRSKRNMAEGF